MAAGAGVVTVHHPRRPTASLVLPAHNEGTVLGRTLRGLGVGADPGEFEVIVVANACSDDTAAVARLAEVQVIETSTGGKVNALNLGDQVCSVFPRIYLDADVELDVPSVRALVSALREPGVLACAPMPTFELSRTSWMVRKAHRTHYSLMAERRGLAGAGAYALSEDGHAKVFPLPSVTSDDGWVDSAFDTTERVVVPGARTVVRPARTVRAELRRRVRVRMGNNELATLGRTMSSAPLRIRTLAAAVADRSIGIADAAGYLLVVGLDRLLTRTRRLRAGGIAWSTDSTSR